MKIKRHKKLELGAPIIHRATSKASLPSPRPSHSRSSSNASKTSLPDPKANGSQLLEHFGNLSKSQTPQHRLETLSKICQILKLKFDFTEFVPLEKFLHQ